LHRNISGSIGEILQGGVTKGPHEMSLLSSISITLWLFNIAMENGPFIDGLPIRNGDFPWQTVK
jgi:hypothetical protein